MEITPLPRALSPLCVFPQTQEFWCLNLAEMESRRRNVCRCKATVTPLRPIATAVPISPGWAPGCHPTLPHYEHTPGALLSSQLFGMRLAVPHVPSDSVRVVTRSSTPLYELRGDLLSLGEPVHGP